MLFFVTPLKIETHTEQEWFDDEKTFETARGGYNKWKKFWYSDDMVKVIERAAEAKRNGNMEEQRRKEMLKREEKEDEAKRIERIREREREREAGRETGR